MVGLFEAVSVLSTALSQCDAYVTTKVKVSFSVNSVADREHTKRYRKATPDRTKNPAIAKMMPAWKEKEKGISEQQQREKRRCHQTGTYEVVGK